MSNEFHIELGAGAAEILRKFGRMPVNMQEGVRKGLQRGLLTAETRIRTNTSVKFRRGGAGLSGRLTSYVRPSGNELDGAIGFRKTRGFPYELSHEFGASAHRGAMTVPISPEAKAASGRGQGAREAFGDRLGLIKGMGKALLIEKRYRGGGKGGGAQVHNRVDVHYVLIKSLPPRLRFRENVAAEIPNIARQMQVGLMEGIRNA